MRHVLPLLLACAPAWAQDESVGTVLAKYKSARPTGDELAIWRLDWHPDFATAKARAADQRRPFLFIWNRNITGPDSLYTGHC